MSSWTPEQALEYWVEKKLLTQNKANELAAALKGSYVQKHGVPKAVGIFATVGAILVGLGVLLFVGSNWADMTPFQRIATLFLGYGVAAAAAYVSEQRGLHKTSESLWFLTDLVFGANIFLLAQVFHYSLTYWQGPFLWMLGALAMGYARQTKVHGYLAVPLAIFALGWIGSGGGRFFGAQFEFLTTNSGLRPVLMVLGAGLTALGLLARGRKGISFLAQPCLSWGMLLILIPLIISSFDAQIAEEIFDIDGTVKQWLILAGSLAAVAASLVWGDMQRSEPKVYLLVLTALLFILLIQADGTSGVGVVFRYSQFYYFLYILLLFALSLWTVWIAIITENSKLLNIGMVAAALIIIVQYFSWSFLLLDRSIAFILGGLLLIVMTLVVERKRRSILSSFK